MSRRAFIIVWSTIVQELDKRNQIAKITVYKPYYFAHKNHIFKTNILPGLADIQSVWLSVLYMGVS